LSGVGGGEGSSGRARWGSSKAVETPTGRRNSSDDSNGRNVRNNNGQAQRRRREGSRRPVKESRRTGGQKASR
jgi:hypothetical protein